MSKPVLPECEHVPILMAMPGHPDYVAVECIRCHATTGYGLDALDAWERWKNRDIAIPTDALEGLDGGC